MDAGRRFPRPARAAILPAAHRGRSLLRGRPVDSGHRSGHGASRRARSTVISIVPVRFSSRHWRLGDGSERQGAAALYSENGPRVDLDAFKDQLGQRLSARRLHRPGYAGALRRGGSGHRGRSRRTGLWCAGPGRPAQPTRQRSCAHRYAQRGGVVGDRRRPRSLGGQREDRAGQTRVAPRRVLRGAGASGPTRDR